MKKVSKMLIVITTCSVMILSILKPAAYAGMINTETQLIAQDRTKLLDSAERFLLEESVSEVLVDLGVDQHSVFERLANLTDAELLTFSNELDQAPAGAGALEVIGVVFLVLLLLELVGVTDVFKRL